MVRHGFPWRHYPVIIQSMAVGRITKRAVEAIPLPVGTARNYLWDDTLKGFGVMVTSKDARSYLIQYQMGGRGAATRRATIGRHGSPWTAEKARDRAADLLEMVRRGVDPVEHDRLQRAAAADGKAEAERLAFDKYVDLFGKYYLDANKLRSAEDIKSVFRRDLTPFFKTRPISALTRNEIARRLDEIGERSKSASLKAHKWLKKMLSWAEDRGDIASSVMEKMPPPAKDGKRDRVLKGPELKAVWLASDKLGEPFGPFVKTLLLTGQRLREVAGMNWSEVDLDKAEWIIPAARSKNDRDHLCPLSPQVVDLLKARFPDKKRRKGFIFTTTGKTAISGFSKAKAALDREIAAVLAKGGAGELKALPAWVFHDLRRSFSTGAQSMGFAMEVVEACLNHVSGKRGGLASIYQLYEYQAEKTAVANAWGRHVEGLLAPQENKIVPIAAARERK